METLGSSVDNAVRQDYYTTRLHEILEKIENEHKTKISQTHRQRIHEMFAFQKYARKTWRDFVSK